MLTKVKTAERPHKGVEEEESRPSITNVTRKPSVKEQLEEKKTEETSAEDAKKEWLKAMKEEHDGLKASLMLMDVFKGTRTSW